MKMKRCQVNPACILTIEEPACLFPIMIFNGEEGFSFARYFQKFRGQQRPVPCPQPDADVPVMLTDRTIAQRMQKLLADVYKRQ